MLGFGFGRWMSQQSIHTLATRLPVATLEQVRSSDDQSFLALLLLLAQAVSDEITF